MCRPARLSQSAALALMMCLAVPALSVLTGCEALLAATDKLNDDENDGGADSDGQDADDSTATNDSGTTDAIDATDAGDAGGDHTAVATDADDYSDVGPDRGDAADEGDLADDMLADDAVDDQGEHDV